MNEDKLYNYYNMLREFYYEKNGLENTIEFLEYMINELKRMKGEDNE